MEGGLRCDSEWGDRLHLARTRGEQADLGTTRIHLEWAAHANLATAPFSRARSDSELIDEWLAGFAVTTRRGYRYDITCLQAFLAARDVSSLTMATAGDLRQFQDALRSATALDNQGRPTDKPLSHNSQVRRLRGVRSFYGFATNKARVLLRDPSQSLRVPAQQDMTTKRILTAEEVLKAIALEPDFANQVLLRFVYDTGVRVSELVAIAWSDFRRGTNGTRVTVIGKDNAERTILLHPEMWRQLEILRELTDGQPRDRPFGVSAETVRKTVLAATTRAGIDKAVSTHWLRHCNATHALRAGADISVVRENLGHASLTTTTKYVHADPNDAAGLYLARSLEYENAAGIATQNDTSAGQIPKHPTH
mgnify:CR=1 FL=1